MSDDIHVKGLAELNKFLSELPEKLQRNVLRGSLRAGAVPIRDEARQGVHKVSGELAAGIKVSTKSSGTRVFARVKLTGEHAFVGHMLEYTGAKPHTITAHHGSALDIGGKIVSTIHHPGFQPKPFMRPALDTKAPDAVLAAGNYMKDRLQTKHGLDTSDVELEVEP